MRNGETRDGDRCKKCFESSKNRTLFPVAFDSIPLWACVRGSEVPG